MGHEVAQAQHADDGQAEHVLHFLDGRFSPWPRSSRSSAINTPAGVAPCARMISTDSRIAVPAVITSSTISTRPVQRRADDRAAFAVVLGFLAVERERQVATSCSASAAAVVVTSGMPL